MITVTGSTGLLGRRVAQRFSDLDVEQRLVVRTRHERQGCRAATSQRLTTMTAQLSGRR
jgi:hypothetical protein